MKSSTLLAMNYALRYFVFLSLTFFATSSFATDFKKICLYFTKGQNATSALNQAMVEDYPELQFLFKNPIQFFETMRTRFNAEKMISPSDPHSFDFSELGLPAVRWIQESIPQKLNQPHIQNLINSPDGKIYHRYLNELLTECNQVLSLGKVSYRKTLELSYYASRALGHFDTQNHSVFARNFLKIDRAVDGYQQHSILREYELYQKRSLDFFMDRTFSKGFAKSVETFQSLFQSQDELGLILVPTPINFSREPFYYLMQHNIGLSGLTNNPIIADGFLRPSGDFFVHDPRHESAKVFEIERYQLKHQLTKNQWLQMGPQMDEWFLELNHAIAEEKDEAFRHAINLVAFNFHHDRGFPLIPSLYGEHKNNWIAIGLTLAMKISGQKTGFRNPLLTPLRASEWLRNFWEQRKAEEIALLKSVQGK